MVVFLEVCRGDIYLHTSLKRNYMTASIPTDTSPSFVYTSMCTQWLDLPIECANNVLVVVVMLVVVSCYLPLLYNLRQLRQNATL